MRLPSLASSCRPRGCVDSQETIPVNRVHDCQSCNQHVVRLSTSHGSMPITLVILASLMVVVGVGCFSATTPRGKPSRRDSALRRELLAMVEADQRVRQGFGSQMTPDQLVQMQAIDAKHTARMKTILVEHGWPGRSLVCDDGNLVPYPVEDAEHVDERRREVGLPSMAEYERKIREVYK